MGADQALITSSGDYIQQWGIEGSDIPSPITKEKETNVKLDEILGVGSDIETFSIKYKLRRRLHSEGHHYLVDYGDNASVPNFYKTVFGHGIYTKKELLSFHLYFIIQEFYPRG